MNVFCRRLPMTVLLGALVIVLLSAGCASRQAEPVPADVSADTSDSRYASSEQTVKLQDAVPEENSGKDAEVAQAALVADVGDDEFEDYDDEDIPVISDPLEPWNRFWFRFNHVVLMDFAKPVYDGYAAVTPDKLRSGLSNVWHNLLAPVRILNRILQGEFAMAGVEFGRFVVNSTVGLGGFGRVAEQNKVLVPFEEEGADFGHTLEVWGFGEGCYIVWPFLGPSTVRDSFGFVADTAATPTFWACGPVGPVRENAGWITGLSLRFNDFGDKLNAYETIVNSAVEPYSAIRDAYVKSRRINAVSDN